MWPGSQIQSVSSEPLEASQTAEGGTTHNFCCLKVQEVTSTLYSNKYRDIFFWMNFGDEINISFIEHLFLFMMIDFQKMNQNKNKIG